MMDHSGHSLGKLLDYIENNLDDSNYSNNIVLPFYLYFFKSN